MRDKANCLGFYEQLPSDDGVVKSADVTEKQHFQSVFVKSDSATSLSEAGGKKKTKLQASSQELR